MSDVKAFKATIKLLEPARVSSKRTKTGYVLYNWRFIPGTTVRGALLYKLFTDGEIDGSALREEVRRPTVRFEPFIAKGLVVAHVFVYESKAEEKLLIKKPLKDILGNIKKAIEENSLDVLAKLVVADPSYENAGGLLKASGSKDEEASSDHLVQVAISKEHRKAKEGLLFSYSVMLPGSEFEGMIYESGGKSLIKPGKHEVDVGGGVSRGFGRAELDVSYENVDQLLERRKASLEESRVSLGDKDYVVLVSRAPIACFTSPFDVLPYYDALPGLNNARLVELAEVGGHKRKLVLGRDLIPVGGWSVYAKAHRPQFDCANFGTIYVYDVGKLAESALDQLARLCTFGLNDLSSIGLNYLSPLEEVCSRLDSEVRD